MYTGTHTKEEKKLKHKYHVLSNALHIFLKKWELGHKSLMAAVYIVVINMSLQRNLCVLCVYG